MKKYSIILLTLLTLANSFANAQVIKQKDLIGLWSLDDGIKNFDIEFFDSSRFTIESRNKPDSIKPRNYELGYHEGESLLTLYFDSSGNSISRKNYLIRKLDSEVFLLQIPEVTEAGKVIFKWNTDKKKTLYLYGMQRKKTITS